MITTNKGLIAIVIGLGLVVAIGFGALITGLIMKFKDPLSSMPIKRSPNTITSERSTLNSAEKININIPKGFFLKTATSSATHISLYIQNNKGREVILIIEPKTGEILRQYMIGSKQ